MEFAVPLMIIAVLAGLYMAWAIGANDVANAMGTSVGSKALTLKQAVLVAAIFEFSGAVVAGGSVSKTVRKGIVDPTVFTDPPLLVCGMIAALLAAAVWLSIASRLGWPVSTTHSIVGAIVGFACVAAGTSAVSWGKVGQIAASWVTSPLVSGTLGFVMFSLLRRFVLATEDPLDRARRVAPFLAFLTTIILALVTLWKGLKHLDIELGPAQTALAAVGVATVAALIAQWLISRIEVDEDVEKDFAFATVERIFGVLQIYTACAVAFAHGSNDVANAIGPLAAVVSTIQANAITGESDVALWMLVLGGTGIVVGLATYGQRVMKTVGERITHLTPSRGYTAEFAAATTIVVASRLGMPISTTHTLIGAVLGVGFARGLAATNLSVVGEIVLSWVITLPAGAFLSITFFYMLRAMFGG